MATKHLTAEAIPLLEKKMDMSLDDIIKMSKKTTASKSRKPLRRPIKSQGFLNGNAPGNAKVQRYMDSRSSIRQGALAQRRSNFHNNQFPVAKEVARKAATIPIRNMALNWKKPRVAAARVQRKPLGGSSNGKDKVIIPKQRPQTLDARFANMKEQRMEAMSQQTMRGGARQITQRRPVQWQRGRGGPAVSGNGRRFGNPF